MGSDLRRFQLLLNSFLRRFCSINSQSNFIPLFVNTKYVIYAKQFESRLKDFKSLAYSLSCQLKCEENIHVPYGIKNGRVDTVQMAQFLSDSYCFLEACIASLKDFGYEENCQRINVSPLELSQYQSSYFKAVRKASDYAQKNFSEFGSALVFGSVVDCKLAKGYSDFDQMIIFNRATLFNVNSLLFARKVVQNLNRYSVLFNTLHHHDAFVLTEVDYMFYPESVFPLLMYNYSASLNREDLSISVNVFKDQESRLNRLQKRVMKIQKKSLKSLSNVWLIMTFFSDYFLLYPLLWHVKKEAIYKRESYSALKKEYSDLNWDLYDSISRIRESVFPSIYDQLQRWSWLSWYHPGLVKKIFFKFCYIPSLLRDQLNNKLILDVQSEADRLLRLASHD